MPQVTVNKQLLPQEGHQIGKRPTERRSQLQVFHHQHGDQRRPELRFQGIVPPIFPFPFETFLFLPSPLVVRSRRAKFFGSHARRPGR